MKTDNARTVNKPIFPISPASSLNVVGGKNLSVACW